MMDRLEPTHVEPRGGLKVFYTNTSFEYHRGDASLIHTDAAGMRDLEPGPDVRVYHFTGTEHGTGPVAADRHHHRRRRSARPARESQHLRERRELRPHRCARCSSRSTAGRRTARRRRRAACRASRTAPPSIRPISARRSSASRARAIRSITIVRSGATSRTLPPKDGPTLRHARERGGRRRQRARRHPRARGRGAARHAHGLEPAPSGHRRRRPDALLRGRHAAVPEDARRARAARRSASLDRRALSLARRLSRARARGREALVADGYLLDEDVETSLATPEVLGRSCAR